MPQAATESAPPPGFEEELPPIGFDQELPRVATAPAGFDEELPPAATAAPPASQPAAGPAAPPAQQAPTAPTGGPGTQTSYAGPEPVTQPLPPVRPDPFAGTPGPRNWDRAPAQRQTLGGITPEQREKATALVSKPEDDRWDTGTVALSHIPRTRREASDDMPGSAPAGGSGDMGPSRQIAEAMKRRGEHEREATRVLSARLFDHAREMADPETWQATDMGVVTNWDKYNGLGKKERAALDARADAIFQFLRDRMYGTPEPAKPDVRGKRPDVELGTVEEGVRAAGQALVGRIPAGAVAAAWGTVAATGLGERWPWLGDMEKEALAAAQSWKSTTTGGDFEGSTRLEGEAFDPRWLLDANYYAMVIGGQAPILAMIAASAGGGASIGLHPAVGGVLAGYGLEAGSHMLDTRQHLLANVGLMIPLDDTGPRTTRVVVYLLWDWFDGGLFDGG